jgi:hypothetical protein
VVFCGLYAKDQITCGKEKYIVTKRFFAMVLAVTFLLTYFFFSVCDIDKLSHNCECGECIVCALCDTFREMIKLFVALASIVLLAGLVELFLDDTLLGLCQNLFSKTPVFLKVCLRN